MGVVFLSTASDGDQFYAIKQHAALARRFRASIRLRFDRFGGEGGTASAASSEGWREGDI